MNLRAYTKKPKLEFSSSSFFLQFNMFIFTSRREWKSWQKFWKRRQERLQFYQALTSFYSRTNLNSLLKVSKKKQSLYKKRLNRMFKEKMKLLNKKL
jgi:hypothetical protein